MMLTLVRILRIDFSSLRKSLRNGNTPWGTGVRRATAWVIAVVVAAVGMVGGTGCYYGQLILGQGDIVLSSRSVHDVIRDKQRAHDRLGRLGIVPDANGSAEAVKMAALAADVAKLQLILDARKYAVEKLALVDNASYTVFFDTGSRRHYPSYVVTAVARDSLTPHLFEFPVVGRLPYKGFFVQAMAEREAAELLRQGYDVSVGPVSAYSTLGNFADPVFTSMLNRDEVELCALIFHELLHATVYHPSDSDFNEGLATWIERIGAVMFFSDRLGAESEIVESAKQRFADADWFSTFLAAKQTELKAFFEREKAAGTPRTELLGKRQSVFVGFQREYIADRRAGRYFQGRFDWFALAPLNNAHFLQTTRYNAGHELYEAVWKSLGQSFTLAMDVFRAAAESETPRPFLENWLRDREQAAHAPDSVYSNRTDPSPAEKLCK